LAWGRRCARHYPLNIGAPQVRRIGSGFVGSGWAGAGPLAAIDRSGRVGAALPGRVWCRASRGPAGAGLAGQLGSRGAARASSLGQGSAWIDRLVDSLRAGAAARASRRRRIVVGGRWLGPELLVARWGSAGWKVAPRAQGDRLRWPRIVLGVLGGAMGSGA
jgi:hypothetical protein